MSAYVVVTIEVNDPERYERYKKDAPQSIEKYGGRYLVRGGALETLEGTWSPRRLVILEFPTLQRAKAWLNSSEYSEARALRHACAKTEMIVVEGV